MRYQEPARTEPSIGLIAGLHDILETGNYTSGRHVSEFEKAFKSKFNLKGDCIAVSSCTNGLIILLKAIGVNRPVISDFTFSATAHACHYACKQFNVEDCGPETFNFNGNLSRDSDCLLPTHVFGNPCDIEYLVGLTESEGIPLIFDAAHALTAKYRGVPVANFGLASVFSFSPTKILSTFEGGMIVSNDSLLTEKLRALRNYGQIQDYDCSLPGLNARMSEIHAVLGLEGLRWLESRVKYREKLVKTYLEELDGLVGFQTTTPFGVHAFKDFSILLEPKLRKKVEIALKAKQIPYKRYFRPISSLTCYPDLHRGPMAYYVFERILQLPLHTNLEIEDIRRICKVVLSVLKEQPIAVSSLAGEVEGK